LAWFGMVGGWKRGLWRGGGGSCLGRRWVGRMGRGWREKRGSGGRGREGKGFEEETEQKEQQEEEEERFCSSPRACSPPLYYPSSVAR